MGTRIRVGTALAAALMGIPLTALPGFACSCAPMPSDPIAMRRADVVFTGVAAGKRVPWTGADGDHDWNFEVDRVFKGRVFELQQVSTATQDTACGFDFRTRSRYVVFAHRHNRSNELATSICDNTRALDGSETANLTGASSPLEGRSHPESWFSRLWPWLAGAAGLSIAYKTIRNRLRIF